MKSRIIVLSAIIMLLMATSSGVANPGGKGDSNRETILAEGHVMAIRVFLHPHLR